MNQENRAGINKLFRLLQFHKNVYIKSNQYILPFVILIIFLYTSYSIIPVTVISSYSLTMVLIFYIMMWVSYQQVDAEDIVTSQIITLKIMKGSLYNWSKLIFLFLIGFAMSVLCVIYPVILNIFRGFHVYTRSITISDIVAALLLHALFSIMGSITGAFFHPRIIKNRKLAILSIAFVALMAYVQGPIGEDYPGSKFITWIFPPLYNVIHTFAPLDYYNLKVIIQALLYCGVYSIILMSIQIICLEKKKY